MDTTSVETPLSQPRKEKVLALWGAVVGAGIGAAVFGLVFFIATQIIDTELTAAFIAVGVAMGVIHGGSAGPLEALRASRWWGRGIRSH